MRLLATTGVLMLFSSSGSKQKLAKGDFLIVPAGVPHMFADISPAGITVMQLYLPKAK